jgi:hypothetical protein
MPVRFRPTEGSVGDPALFAVDARGDERFVEQEPRGADEWLFFDFLITTRTLSNDD